MQSGKGDDYFMRQAIKEAHRALEADEVPIGAVIVIQDKIIARGYNQVEMLTDATAHAEMIAITSAFNYLGAKYLPDATLYVTIEPCTMCGGALFWSKIGRIVFGARDEKHGGISLHGQGIMHPKTRIEGGVLQEECALLMKEFFQRRR